MKKKELEKQKKKIRIYYASVILFFAVKFLLLILQILVHYLDKKYKLKCLKFEYFSIPIVFLSSKLDFDGIKLTEMYKKEDNEEDEGDIEYQKVNFFGIEIGVFSLTLLGFNFGLLYMIKIFIYFFA